MQAYPKNHAMGNMQMETIQNSLLSSSDFWKSRRVCVTGGAGFLGSYLLEKLRERGAGDPRHSDRAEHRQQDKDGLAGPRQGDPIDLRHK